jgi:hypothetical protein
MHWINPDSVPEIAGSFERFIINPHGEVDGFVMTGDQETAILVHTPPHLADELIRELSPGEKLTVRGVRPRGAELLAAIAMVTANGRQIVDEGPNHDRERPKVKYQPLAAEGTVRLSLCGPKGELRGALLTSGMIVRVGPKEAANIAALLAPGARLAVRGEGLEMKYGRVIHALEIGAGPRSLKPMKNPKPRDKEPKPEAKARAA